MSTSQSNELINKALLAYQDSQNTAISALEKQLKSALDSGEYAGRVEQFTLILESYLTEHQMDMSTLAMLSGVSKNTMTRLKKSVDSSRLETLSAVLGVMGMELVIARKVQTNG